MKKSDTFSDRRQEAEAAKIRLMAKFKSRPGQDDPEFLERAAARRAQSAAQAERKAAALLEKKNKAESLKVEAAAAAEAKQLVEEQQLKALAEAEDAQKIIDEASRKAKRDARYANRKARS